MANLFSSLDNYLLSLANGQPAQGEPTEVTDFSSVTASILKNKTLYCCSIYVDDDAGAAFGLFQSDISNIVQNSQVEITAGNINGFYISNISFEYAKGTTGVITGKLLAYGVVTFY